MTDYIKWPVKGTTAEYWKYKTGTDLRPDKHREAVALMADVPVEDVRPDGDGGWAVPIRPVTGVANHDFVAPADDIVRTNPMNPPCAKAGCTQRYRQHPGAILARQRDDKLKAVKESK